MGFLREIEQIRQSGNPPEFLGRASPDIQSDHGKFEIKIAARIARKV
jgi:hypothetical protein